MNAIIIGWAFVIGLLVILLLPIASLWLWGGVRRSALGHLMAGALLLVSGAAFLYVAEINAFARMDNAYLGNAWIGSYFTLLGVILLLGSLAGYGVRAWIAALSAVATAAFGILGVNWFARFSPTPLSTILLYAALVLGGVLLYISLRGYLVEASIALASTGASFALVWRLSGGDLRAFTPVTIIDEQHFYKPPVLDVGQLVVVLLVAAFLFFAGRFIHGRLRRQSSPADGRLASS